MLFFAPLAVITYSIFRFVAPLLLITMLVGTMPQVGARYLKGSHSVTITESSIHPIHALSLSVRKRAAGPTVISLPALNRT